MLQNLGVLQKQRLCTQEGKRLDKDGVLKGLVVVSGQMCWEGRRGIEGGRERERERERESGTILKVPST
jgi:hypothetical protein